MVKSARAAAITLTWVPFRLSERYSFWTLLQGSQNASFSAGIGTPSDNPSGQPPGVQERLGHAECSGGLAE